MRSMRRSLLTGTVLASLVALPALFARPWADERFVMYMPEKLVGGNPFLLWNQVMREVTAFIDVGVFRPMSRLGFYLEHWLVVRAGIVTGIAPNVMMSVVKVAMIAFLLATGLATVDQYRRAASDPGRLWQRTIVLLPFLFAGSLVLINPAVHPLTLFPGLYLGTASLALAIPLWLGRALLRNTQPRGVRFLGHLGIAALLGAVLASMIELAWIGLILGLAHLILLRVQQIGWRNLASVVHLHAFRLWVAMAAGFAVVFLPARFFIARYCAAGGCYAAASPSVGVEFVALLPFRIGSAFAPVGLLAQFRSVVRMMTHPSVALLISFGIAVVAGALLVLAWRRTDGEDGDGGTSMVAPGRVVPLVAYYTIVILLAAVISAVSSGLQAKGFNPAPWRETGFGWIGWAVLASVGLALLADRLRAKPWSAVALVLIVLTFTATTVINREDMRRVSADPEGMLHITAGHQLVDFDPAENAARCATIAGLREVAGSGSELRKANLEASYLDAAAQNNYGVLFCDPEAP
jgi:hypothetical protein